MMMMMMMMTTTTTTMMMMMMDVEEEEEEEDDDVEGDDVEEDRSQDREADFVRACAVETHMDMSQEPFCVYIYREFTGHRWHHLD